MRRVPHLTTGHSRDALTRSAVAFLLAVALLLSPVAPLVEPVVAYEVLAMDTGVRTEADIRAMWQALKPTYQGEPYSVAPVVQTPYAPGVVRPEFLNDGLRTINFARYLAGLPYDVKLDADLTADAQYGAVLLAATSPLSHEPPKPPDMEQSFYDRARASTENSNIGSGYQSVASFQTGCLADRDTFNLARVGHRRWLLNPQMQKTGLGYAEKRYTTYVKDVSRPQKVDYTAVLWPSAGVFPVEMFCGQTPWSITLNPDKFDFQSTGHTVTMRRLADGRTWTFNASNTNTSGQYFSANFGGYGVRNAFIFRPDPASISYKPGDEFQITLSGGIFHKGTTTPATVRYWTQIVSMDSSKPPTPPSSVAEALLHTDRLAAGCRFSTAVVIASAGSPGWEGVKNVVIASGDDRSAADPLTAAGLCWAYDAPMMLVSSSSTPAEVRTAVKQIVAANGKITLRIVGGTRSVPDARIAEIRAAAGHANVDVDRVQATGDRYDTARAIALRMQAVAAADPSKTMPSVALFANGADPAKFSDALALSPISAATGAPVLLVTGTGVPAPTRRTVSDLKPGTRIVGGGPATVSDAVREDLSATRWAGRDRYHTAATIADQAVANRWLSRSDVGIAASLPDALTGGSFIGGKGGVLLLTEGTSLTTVTKDWLSASRAELDSASIFGGTRSITDTVRVQIGTALK